jgi:tRNA G18 (ribose-2'-O)-methylase SpoU
MINTPPSAAIVSAATVCVPDMAPTLATRHWHTGRMAERIDDASDARLVDYRDLRSVAARRTIEGDEFFIAEGPVSIERLVASGHRVRSVVVSERKYERLRHLLDPLDAPTYIVARDVLHDIVGFDLHRGAIAAADRRPLPTLAELAAGSRRLAVLEGLNDPENLGAIARSARAFGIDGLVLDPTCIDPYTRRTVRVSMGEILFLPCCRVAADDWPDALPALHDASFETWALTPAADSADIWTLPVPDRLAVVLGAEGPGLTRHTMTAASRRVRLPIDADVDSLNVGAAAAVAFAVAARPR